MNYGRYQIIRELGRGSMGVIYLARDPQIERLVAVKVLRRDRMENEAFVKRFLKEAKVVGRLYHPHTVTLHDIGREGDDIYIAMEYVEGVPLSDIIREKRLSVKEVVDLGIQVAETLDYFHGKGVVHRDIKPSNIIVQPDGWIRITDFGIARIEDAGATLQTQVGETIGTPSYMSPEQVLGKPIDGRSDIFSLGVLLYELSTGMRPFGGEGKTLATVFNEIIQVTPPDPYIASAQVPKELSAIVMKALRKEPEKRFQSGSELVGALRACLDGQNGAVAPIVPTPSVLHKWSSFVIPLACAAVITAIAGGGFYYARNYETPAVKVSTVSRQAVRPVPHALMPSHARQKLARLPMPIERKEAPALSQPATVSSKVVPPVKTAPENAGKAMPAIAPAGSSVAKPVKQDARTVAVIKPVTPAPVSQAIPAAKRLETPVVKVTKQDAKPVVVIKPASPAPVPQAKPAVKRPDVPAAKVAKQEAKPVAMIRPATPAPVPQAKPAKKKPESPVVKLAVDSAAKKAKTSVSEKPKKVKPAKQAPPPARAKANVLPRFAFLKVRTMPEGATVYVDGNPMGTSPLTVKLDLGKYRVKLCRSGYLDTECLIRIDRMTDYPIIERLRPVQ